MTGSVLVITSYSIHYTKLYEIDREKLQTKLVMQVHDELVLEVPDDELVRVRVELPPLMTQVAKLRVPLAVEVGVGANWDEAH